MMHAFDSNASTHNIKTERVLGLNGSAILYSPQAQARHGTTQGTRTYAYGRLRDQVLEAEITRDLAMEATLNRLLRSG